MRCLSIYCALFIAALTPSVLAEEGKAAKALALLKDKCTRCHGAEMDGRKKVKGKFDMTPLMKGDHLWDDPAWPRVIEQIEDQAMPPEDSKTELSAEEGKLIVDMLKGSFRSKTLPRRTLTPHEVGYSLSQIFEYDLEAFDPFERLRFASDEGKAYSTVHATEFVSADFLKELEFGIGEVTKHFVLPDDYGVEGKFRDIKTVMAPHEHVTGPVTFIDLDHSSVPKLTGNESEEAIKRQQATRREHMARQAKEGKKVRFDIRMSRDEQLIAKTYLRKYNFPAGRYRVTFKATALNRHLVKEAFERGEKGLVEHANEHIARKNWSPKYQEDWKRLLHEPARLEFRQLGYLSDLSHRRNLETVSSSKKGRVLGSLLIEDNVEKEYAFEFELKMRSGLYLNWINGPTIRVSPNAIGMINLNGLKSKKGKGFFDRAGAEYELPCIRILSEIKIEQLSNGRSRNRYAPGSARKVDEAWVAGKIDSYIEELSLEHNVQQLREAYERLPAGMSPLKKYETALKLVTMSPDHLFIQFSDEIQDAKARYVSYALLKSHPSAEFKRDYRLFEGGKMSAGEFVGNVVADPKFEKFLRHFVDGWLELGTELDEKEFSQFKRQLPFRKETVAYLNHLFANNRPVKELYSSDYTVLDLTLANYYGIQDPGGLERYKFSPVKLNRARQGGVLSQGNFFLSHSSGVDPLPFARAKWVSENIFDRKIPEPPNNVDSGEFVTTRELKTFQERTAAHAQSESCRSCHQLLDPIALAMHNFDTIGQRITLQDLESEARLQHRIAKAEAQMATAFTRELVSFVVGRKTTVFDSHAVSKIVKNTAPNHYALQDILAEVVNVYFRK